jgi:hypothetical protein
MKLFLKTIVDDVAVDTGTTGKTSVLACREDVSLQAFWITETCYRKKWVHNSRIVLSFIHKLEYAIGKGGQYG